MANKITCTCGHSWNKSDSSKKDMRVCHVCGKDNTMKNGGWLDKFDTPKAQVGALITGTSDLISPVYDIFSKIRNLGTSDYSDKKDFDAAYSAAKKAGEEEFVWNSKRYNTKYAGTPRQEVGTYGVQGKPVDLTGLRSDPSRVNLYPMFGKYLPGHLEASIVDGDGYASINYSSAGNRPWLDVIKPEKGEKAYYVYGANIGKFSEKATSLPLGMYSYIYDGVDNRPSDWELFTNNCADNVCDAFGIPRSRGLQTPKGAIEKIKKAYPTLDVTGRTKDDYDKFIRESKQNSLTKERSKDVLSNADRLLNIYYSPDTPSSSKKDIGYALQRSLINQGYELPKSKTKLSELDTIVGDETLGAIKNWKSKNKKQDGGAVEGRMAGLTDKGFNFNPAWGGAWRDGGVLQPPMAGANQTVPMAQNGLTYLEPNSSKLPRVGPSSELAMSVGGENGEPAYLIPSMKYGRMQVDPTFEFRRTGEHLGGPFKTWQEAEAWERDVRHPYVEKGQSIPTPYRRWGQFAMGGSIPGSVGFTYARVAGAAPSEGPYAKKTLPSAQDGEEVTYTHNPSGSREAYTLKRTVTPYTSKRDIRRLTQMPTDPRQVNFLSNYAGAIGEPGLEGFQYPTSVPFEGKKHWNIDRFIIDPQFGTSYPELRNQASTREEMRNNVLADMYKYNMLQNPDKRGKAWRQAKRFVRTEIDPRTSGAYYEEAVRSKLPFAAGSITDAVDESYMRGFGIAQSSAQSPDVSDDDYYTRDFKNKPITESRAKEVATDWLRNYKGLSKKQAKQYIQSLPSYTKFRAVNSSKPSNNTATCPPGYEYNYEVQECLPKKSKFGGVTETLPSAQQGKSIDASKEFLKDWYSNRKITDQYIQGAFDLDRPAYMKNLQSLPEYTVVDSIDNNPNVTGRYEGDTNKLLITKGAPEHVKTHELNHYLNTGGAGDYMRTIHGEISKNELLPQSQVQGVYKDKYDYFSNPDEVHSRIMVLREKAGIKPNETVTPEKLKGFMKTYKGDVDNINDLLNMSKGEEGLLNMLNFMAKGKSSTPTTAQNGAEMKFYQQGLDWTPRNISRNGGWLDKYSDDVPEAQAGKVLQQRYSTGPMMGDLAQQSGAPSQTEVARQAQIRKEAAAREQQLAARARYEAMPKIGPARERNYSEQVQAEEQRRRLNQQYADQNPEVTTDESGDIVPSGYGRFMQTYGPNLDKFARSWETPLAIQGAADIAYGLGKAAMKYAPESIGEYFKSLNIYKHLPEDVTVSLSGVSGKNPYLHNKKQILLSDFENDINQELLKGLNIKKVPGELKVKVRSGNTNYAEYDPKFTIDLYHDNKNIGYVGLDKLNTSDYDIPGVSGTIYSKVADQPYEWAEHLKGKGISGEVNKAITNALKSNNLPNLYSSLVHTPEGINRWKNLVNKGKAVEVVPHRFKLLKEGGEITEDDEGYWNPQNWGKPVEINSNKITMEGVLEPLLGVSDTGDTQMMYPGKNYTFNGTKVVEYPREYFTARDGKSVNRADEYPLEKLDNLLNFTNYNKPKAKNGWLEKYK